MDFESQAASVLYLCINVVRFYDSANALTRVNMIRRSGLLKVALLLLQVQKKPFI